MGSVLSTVIRIVEEAGAPAPPTVPPESYTVLRRTDTNSESFLEVLWLFIYGGRMDEEAFLELNGPAAVEAVEFLDELLTTRLKNQHLYRPRTIELLHRLCALRGILPTSCTLYEGIEYDPKGTYANCMPNGVSVCTWASQKVQVKTITHLEFDESVKQSFKEAITWRHLNHRNLLPLLGVCKASSESPIAPLDLVSPWMEGGPICVFIKKNPHFNRFELLADVCEGLKYLHLRFFVHGNLSVNNVFVDGENRACLADFYLKGDARNCITRPASLVAPELVLSESQARGGRRAIPSFKAPVDVYMFGFLVVEVLTGNHVDEPKAMTLSVNGRNLKRPPSPPNPAHPIWDLVEQCWMHRPEERPQLDEILQILTSPDTPPWRL